MFGKLLTTVALLGIGLLNAAAGAPSSVSPGTSQHNRLICLHSHRVLAVAIPTSGKYRIQNAATGLFMDDPNSNQGMHNYWARPYILSY